MSLRLRPCAAALLILVAGCTHAPAGAPEQVAPTPPPALTAFDSCAQLLREFRSAAADDAGIGTGPVRAAPMAKAADATAPAFSGTNVQEPGVDEPDTVKTDGRRIVTLTAGVLHVVDPATRQVTGRLDLALPGPAQLLLAGNHALILGQAAAGPASRGGPAVRGGPAIPGGPAGRGDSGTSPSERLLPRPFGGRTDLVLVDLAGPPRVLSRYQSDGQMIDARQTGSVARIVLSTAPRILFPFRATTPAGAPRENKAAIDAAPISAWLPAWQITTGAATTQGRLGCGSVVRPPGFSGTKLLTVLSVDLSAPALGDGDPIGIVAGADHVYATRTSLYVADDQSLGPVRRVPATLRTAIYRFAIPAGAGRPTYAAYGTVPGTLLSSYAMSEWDGHLRVATTSGDVSSVRVLDETNGRFAQVGMVSGLGANEQIYAVRFAGPRGYVVTFRQMDPLYGLDLTDPARPRTTGSLKITGYSAYLQPVDDGHLLGIGQEATTRGQPLGTQISFFDVSGPAPRRLAEMPVPAGASSQAESDPHAVLWWPAARLLVVPISAPSAREAALATRVSDEGLSTVARVAVPSGTVTRQLVVGDTLWIMTDSGLLATPLSALSTSGSGTWVSLR